MKVKLTPSLRLEPEDPTVISLLYEEMIDRIAEADRRNRLREAYGSLLVYDGTLGLGD